VAEKLEDTLHTVMPWYRDLAGSAAGPLLFDFVASVVPELQSNGWCVSARGTKQQTIAARAFVQHR